MATDDRDDDGDDDVEHEYGDGDVGDDEHDFFLSLVLLGLTSLPSNQVS